MKTELETVIIAQEPYMHRHQLTLTDHGLHQPENWRCTLIKIVFFLIVCLSSSAWATDYYIKNGGSDVAAGTSDGAVWATVAKVNDFAVSPGFSNGDTINFAEGDTWTSDETLGWDGSSINWGTITGLTIQSYNNGGGSDLPHIDGNTQQPISIVAAGITNLTVKDLDCSGMDWTSGYRSDDFNVKLFYMTNLVVDGLTVDGRAGASSYERHDGAIVAGDVEGTIEIMNCTLTNFWKGTMPTVLFGTHEWGTADDSNGINVWYEPSADTPKTSGAVSIHDNTIQYFYSDCIVIGGIRSGTSIYNNTLSDFGEQGIDHKASTNVDIYHNDISHNAFGLSPGGSSESGVGIITNSATGSWPSYSSSDIRIWENYIHDCELAGIRIQGTAMLVKNNYLEDVKGIEIKGNANGIYGNILNLTAAVYAGATAGELSAFRIENKSWCDNINIVNNTIYVSHSDFLYGIRWEGVSGQTGNLVENNIIQMTVNSSSVFPLSVITFDPGSFQYNYLYNANHTNRVSFLGTVYDSTEAADWQSAEGTGANFSNPQMVDPANDDFTLGVGANALDNKDQSGQDWDTGILTANFVTFVLSYITGADNGDRDAGAYEKSTTPTGTSTTAPGVQSSEYAVEVQVADNAPDVQH